MDSHSRSMAKALSWRGLAMTITAAVALAVTGKMHLAAAICVADAAIKVGMYYVHERIWNHVGFGRARSPEFQI